MGEQAKVAFVGLGKLGHLLIGHLMPVARERGVEVGVLDIDAGLTARVAADHGATALTSLRDFAGAGTPTGRWTGTPRSRTGPRSPGV